MTAPNDASWISIRVYDRRPDGTAAERAPRQRYDGDLAAGLREYPPCECPGPCPLRGERP
ncbi:hypothetical protein GCM10020229_35370 [Kitasatospora albolonga]